MAMPNTDPITNNTPPSTIQNTTKSAPNTLQPLNDHALIHPLAILAISDAVTRRVMRYPNRRDPLAGLISGRSQANTPIVVEKAFECMTVIPSEQALPVEKTGRLFHDLHTRERVADFLLVLGVKHERSVVGMFAIGPLSGPLPHHKATLLLIQQRLRLPDALLLLFHPEVAQQVKSGAVIARLPFSTYKLVRRTGLGTKSTDPTGTSQTEESRGGNVDIDMQDSATRTSTIPTPVSLLKNPEPVLGYSSWRVVERPAVWDPLEDLQEGLVDAYEWAPVSYSIHSTGSEQVAVSCVSSSLNHGNPANNTTASTATTLPVSTVSEPADSAMADVDQYPQDTNDSENTRPSTHLLGAGVNLTSEEEGEILSLSSKLHALQMLKSRVEILEHFLGSQIAAEIPPSTSSSSESSPTSADKNAHNLKSPASTILKTSQDRQTTRAIVNLALSRLALLSARPIDNAYGATTLERELKEMKENTLYPQLLAKMLGNATMMMAVKDLGNAVVADSLGGGAGIGRTPDFMGGGAVAIGNSTSTSLNSEGISATIATEPTSSSSSGVGMIGRRG